MSRKNKVSWINDERWFRENKVTRIKSVLQYWFLEVKGEGHELILKNVGCAGMLRFALLYLLLKYIPPGKMQE